MKPKPQSTRALAHRRRRRATPTLVRTIIHVTRNERAQALRDADRAVQLAPNSSTALIAQSYARQAGFDLEGARESLRAAVRKKPQRRARLRPPRRNRTQLRRLRPRKRGRQPGRRRSPPTSPAPKPSCGFSKLAEIDTDGARKAFARAIEPKTAPTPSPISASGPRHHPRRFSRSRAAATWKSPPASTPTTPSSAAISARPISRRSEAQRTRRSSRSQRSSIRTIRRPGSMMRSGSRPRTGRLRR